ncbi:MAG: MFS transporter [Burkholderiales bacterium]|nr:MFS transporter [Burkholderiales bacterium]
MSRPLPYWRIAGLYFWYFAFVGAFSPFFGPYLQALGRSAWEIGVLLGLMAFARIVAANFWAWRADRDGRREHVLRVSLALAVLVWLAVFPAREFATLAVVLAAVAFTTGGAVPLTESITFGRLRGDVDRYGGIRLWGSVGFIAAVLGVGVALEVVGVSRLPWIVLATLVGALAHALAIPAITHPRAERGDSVLPMLAQPEIAIFLAACFFMSMGHGTLYGFYSIFLAESGYSTGFVGAMWSVGVVAEIAAFLAMPALMRRFGAGPILVASFATAVVRFVVIGWLVASPVALTLAQLLHGTTFGTYHAAALAVIQRWFSGTRQTRGQAVYLSISFGAGGMAGSLLSGALWDAVGPAWTFTAASIAALAGLMLVARRAKIYGGRPAST